MSEARGGERPFPIGRPALPPNAGSTCPHLVSLVVHVNVVFKGGLAVCDVAPVEARLLDEAGQPMGEWEGSGEEGGQG